MKLDEHLWDALQAHGLSEAHLDMLLRALETQRNGSLSWHYAHGRLTQCDLRVVFGPGRGDATRVSESVLDSVLRLR